MMNFVKLKDQLIIDEDIRYRPYKDKFGNLTIGVGRNLDANGISYQEAMIMLDNDIQFATNTLAVNSWFIELDDLRQRVLVNMMFNLGPTRFYGFRNMIKALAIKDYEGAAREMLNSDWAKQVGARASRLANQMRTGVE